MHGCREGGWGPFMHGPGRLNVHVHMLVHISQAGFCHVKTGRNMTSDDTHVGPLTALSCMTCVWLVKSWVQALKTSNKQRHLQQITLPLWPSALYMALLDTLPQSFPSHACSTPYCRNPSLLNMFYVDDPYALAGMDSVG